MAATFIALGLFLYTKGHFSTTTAELEEQLQGYKSSLHGKTCVCAPNKAVRVVCTNF